MNNYWLNKSEVFSGQPGRLDRVGPRRLIMFIERSILNFWQEEEFASPLFYSKVRELMCDVRNRGGIEEFVIVATYENSIVIGIKIERNSNWTYLEQELT